MPIIRKIQSSKGANNSEAAAELKTFLTDLARDNEFSGAVLLARHGKIVFTGAYGEANKSFAIPNHLDTKFNLKRKSNHLVIVDSNTNRQPDQH